MIESLAGLLGTPIVLEELKHKPGRRRTLRARGPLGNAIVKTYASERAPTVARRVEALAAGPREPVVPELLYLDPALHLVVLSDVPGAPLREALLAGDLAACRRAGRALGSWQAWWQDRAPETLTAHTAERELEILRARMAAAEPQVEEAVACALSGLAVDWDCRTIVHRDLYEEQVMVAELIGLIDVDDVALGPPELDLGNLIAHVELLERRTGQDLRAPSRALLDGYESVGPPLERHLLGSCRSLSLLRLACLNDEADLVEVALGNGIAA